MTLTISKPETEARLLRFATSRGLSPLDAIDELLDLHDARSARSAALRTESIDLDAVEAIRESFTEEGEDIAMENVFTSARAKLGSR
jgi:protein-disulfide isomerase-like protein with CxxC motif